MTILVTGASGFVGKYVVAELLRKSIKVRVACRQGIEKKFSNDNLENCYLSGAGYSSSDWIDAVRGCTAVIHLAALAHILADRDDNIARAFRLANVDFARACAEAAANAGVRRFIFMSSVGVHGGSSGPTPINADSSINPHTQYAFSKAEAEQVLKAIALESGMELTIIRPPLIYGYGAPGNFSLLVNAITRGCPLPLGLIVNNRRSFVSIYNILDLIFTCLYHPAAANQAFLVSDGEDLSTAELICRLGRAMDKPVRIFSVKIGLLAFGARLFSMMNVFNSLCGSLQLDISKTRQLLQWEPVVSLDEGLRRSTERMR